MKERRNTNYNTEKFEISNNLVNKIPVNLSNNVSIKSKETLKNSYEPNYKNNLIKKQIVFELPAQIKSVVHKRRPLRLHESISSNDRTSIVKINNKQNIFTKGIQVHNKRRKKKVENSIYDSNSIKFQIRKSESDSGKLKHVFPDENFIRIISEKKKSSDTSHLCSVFNCLTPVTLQLKSEKVQLPLFKNNYAKGDYNMSEEEKNTEEDVNIKEEDITQETVNEGDAVQPPPTSPPPTSPPHTSPPPTSPPPEETAEGQNEPKPPMDETAYFSMEKTPSKEGGDPDVIESPKENAEPAQPEHQETAKEPVTPKVSSPKTSPSKTESKKIVVHRVSNESSLLYTHSSVIDGLEQARKEAAITTEMIIQLKNKILSYEEKEHLTPEDIDEMKATQAELMEKLTKYGETSKYIAELVGMTEVPSSQLDMSMPPMPRSPALPRNEKTTSASVRGIVGMREKATIGPPIPGVREVDDIYLERYSEEKLPKVIVCGIGAIDQVPKIIICEPIKKADVQPFQKSQGQSTGDQAREPIQNVDPQSIKMSINSQTPPVCQPPAPTSARPPSITSPNNQCKQIPPTQPPRGPLQEQLADKQQAIENLHMVINRLQDDVQKLNEENCKLHQQIAFSCQPPQPKICRRELYQRVRKTLPPFEKRNEDGYNEDMEEPLSKLGEGDLPEVQDKRHKRQTQPQCMNTGQQPQCKKMLPVKETQTESEAEKDKKLRLLEEQCRKLNKDFNKKVTEMAILKVELDRTRKEVENARESQRETENLLQNALQNINKLESEKIKLLQFKEQYEDMEQDANLAKQMYITGQDELEESRALFEDVSKQLEEYRRKYLHTLTTLEEQKRDMDRKYQEHEEKVAADIQKTRQQLQEVEEDLKTNKYMLKEAQQKLKETQQMHAIALNNVNDLSQDLQSSKKELDKLKEALDKTKHKNNEDKIAALEEKVKIAEKKAEKLDLENEKLMAVLNRIEEAASENERQLEEKTHETKLLQAQMETLREESARQISRSKGTFEAMKSSMQTQMSKLEAELIQTRTVAYVAKQDKITIQKKMQMQIANLNTSVNEAQNGLLSLQGHVTYLKGSYTSLLTPENVTSIPSDSNLCPCPPNCHKPSLLKPELLSPESN